MTGHAMGCPYGELSRIRVCVERISARGHIVDSGDAADFATILMLCGGGREDLCRCGHQRWEHKTLGYVAACNLVPPERQDTRQSPGAGPEPPYK
jgi:hypothetical protein